MSYFGEYPFLLAVKRGLIPGHSTIRKFGQNPIVSAAEEDVWYTGAVRTAPTTAAVVAVTHTDPDIAAGTGARSLFIQGLDADFNEQSETIDFGVATGTVNSVNTYIRVFRAYCVTGGTYAQTYATPFGTNENAITATIGGDNQFTIGAGQGQTLTTHYTIPLGCTGYLYRTSVSIETGKTADVALWQRQNADDSTAPVSPRRVVHRFESGATIHESDFDFSDSFPAKTDIWMSVLGTAGGGKVDAEYHLILVQG